MGKKIEYYDDTLSVKQSFNNITHGENKHGEWRSGEIGTPFGFVLAYAEFGDEDGGVSELRFIWRERLHIRTFNRTLTERSLVCQAKKFTEGIVNEGEMI